MRVVNRVLSVLLGLALAVAGALVLVNLVLVWTGRPWWPQQVGDWVHDLSTSTVWEGTQMRVISACLMVAGLLLLFAQLRRWTPVDLPVAAGEQTSDGTWQIKRRSAEHHLASVASGFAGATTAEAKLKVRKGRWDAVVTADAAPELRGDIEHAVSQAMTAMGAPEGSSSRIRMNRNSRRAH